MSIIIAKYVIRQISFAFNAGMRKLMMYINKNQNHLNQFNNFKTLCKEHSICNHILIHAHTDSI